MKHFASSSFWQSFDSLPTDIQSLARQSISLLKENANHPSLRFKIIKDTPYRSVRIGIHYRALGVSVPDGVQWFWIGTHAEYDKLIK